MKDELRAEQWVFISHFCSVSSPPAADQSSPFVLRRFHTFRLWTVWEGISQKSLKREEKFEPVVLVWIQDQMTHLCRHLSCVRWAQSKGFLHGCGLSAHLGRIIVSAAASLEKMRKMTCRIIFISVSATVCLDPTFAAPRHGGEADLNQQRCSSLL